MLLPALSNGEPVQFGREYAKERHGFRGNPWRANSDGRVVDLSTQRPAVVSQSEQFAQEGRTDAGVGAYNCFVVTERQLIGAYLGGVDDEAERNRSLRRYEVKVLDAAELRGRYDIKRCLAYRNKLRN
jgi:hypothetical protein